MNTSAFHQSVLRLIVLLSLLVFGSAAASAEPQSATADDHRPVEAVIGPDSVTVNESGRPVTIAVEQLEKIYGLPITYEDTRYVHESELKEVKVNNRTRKTMKESGTLTFRYAAPPKDAPLEIRKKLAAEAIAEALRNYNAAKREERFKVIEGDEGFHVVATKFTNTSGQTETLHALLDTPVTIPAGERTASEVLAEICKAVNSAPGQTPRFGGQTPAMWIGGVPGMLFEWHKTTITATNEPARSVLDRLLKEIPVMAGKEDANHPGAFHNVPANLLSWELRTDPDQSWGSALSFYIVRQPGTL